MAGYRPGRLRIKPTRPEKVRANSQINHFRGIKWKAGKYLLFSLLRPVSPVDESDRWSLVLRACLFLHTMDHALRLIE
jgi:hypothetical protein